MNSAPLRDQPGNPDPARQASQALQIETLAANAWPPEQSIVFEGWRLRSARGVTRRANSVWPNAGGETRDIGARLAVVEQYYAAAGLPAIFQICAAAQPPGLDSLLEQRGYRADAHTHVQTTTVAGMLDKLRAQRLQAQLEVEISDTLTADWFALYCACEEVSGHNAAVRHGILQRIQPARGFALLRRAGEPAAVGLGVVEAGSLGIYCMATAPAHRRQGAASAVLQGLAAWSLSLAAHEAYLQVMVHNVEAQHLYAGAGFVTAYDYHYRTRP